MRRLLVAWSLCLNGSRQDGIKIAAATDHAHTVGAY